MNKQARRATREIKTFWSAAFLSIVLLLLGAILQINAFIHENSLLKDSQKRIALLSSQNDTLEAKLSQSNSLENFNQYAIAQAGNYEKVDIAAVRYIHASNSQLAKK